MKTIKALLLLAALIHCGAPANAAHHSFENPYVFFCFTN